jgi:hypothetical protein
VIVAALLLAGIVGVAVVIGRIRTKVVFLQLEPTNVGVALVRFSMANHQRMRVPFLEYEVEDQTAYRLFEESRFGVTAFSVWEDYRSCYGGPAGRDVIRVCFARRDSRVWRAQVNRKVAIYFSFRGERLLLSKQTEVWRSALQTNNAPFEARGTDPLLHWDALRVLGIPLSSIEGADSPRDKFD